MGTRWRRRSAQAVDACTHPFVQVPWLSNARSGLDLCALRTACRLAPNG